VFGIPSGKKKIKEFTANLLFILVHTQKGAGIA
jgi:hypothetical protein